MSYLFLLALVFIFHWVFDYCLQPRKIADTKWSNVGSLFIHIAIYATGLFLYLLVCLIPLGPWKPEIPSTNLAIAVFFFGNLIAHFITDFFTSKITHRLYSELRIHAFFVVLGLDQLLHTLVLLYTTIWLLIQF